MNGMKRKKRISLFDLVNNMLVILITFVLAYPLYFCIIASFSDPEKVALGQTLIWVKDFTLEAYKNIMNETQLWVGYKNTLIYTFFGTLYNLVLTIPAAYVLSKKNLPFHGLLSWFFFLTMYLSGGMIPTYLLIKSLKLLNNPLVMIIGSGVSAYNLIVARQYFSSSIPNELYEAAYIDGASEWKAFTNIAIPLSKPILAVLSLYYGVSHWNSYYNALLYLYKEEYHPLQLVLKKILINNQNTFMMDDLGTSIETMKYLIEKARMAQGMKYSIIFIASAPLLILYPFLQKYFTKGIMIGSVKG